LRPRVDLNLVARALRHLNDSAYFEDRLHQFTSHIVAAIQHVLDNPGVYDAAIEESFARTARSVQAYLAGSTSNETPYEVVYCLKDALTRWKLGGAAIVTFMTEGHNFHLQPLDPWDFIEKSIANYDSKGFKLVVAMIGVPDLYAHKPVFCVPLFHELGHFVDIGRYNITVTSLALNQNLVAAPGYNPQTEYFHRLEHFADLFAACFVGRSSVAALEAIAGAAAASQSHPSTVQRVAVVEAFLAGRNHPVVDLFQAALKRLQLPELKIVFETVDVTPDFDDARTFTPKNIEQVYGMFDSAWSYLFTAIDQNRNPWALPVRKDADVESLTNDLTEKSIRNFAIRQGWNAATSGP